MKFKRIQAIIRISKFDEVRKALHEIGVEFFTYCDVKGVAFQSNNKISYRGSSIHEMVAIPWRNIEIVIPEIDVEEVVDCIKTNAHTGATGDGKIYVSSVDEAIRISLDL
jgi:nitrogen regulatory protein P-II 1